MISKVVLVAALGLFPCALATGVIVGTVRALRRPLADLRLDRDAAHRLAGFESAYQREIDELEALWNLPSFEDAR